MWYYLLEASLYDESDDEFFQIPITVPSSEPLSVSQLDALAQDLMAQNVAGRGYERLAQWLENPEHEWSVVTNLIAVYRG